MTEWMWFVLIGACSGFLGGMLGIGGGVIIVPALILVYELSNSHAPEIITVVAIATSLSCIIFTSLSAAYTQYLSKKINWEIARTMAPFFILGSFSAGVVIPYLPAPTLRLVISVFLLSVAIIMLLSWSPHATRTFPRRLAAWGVGYGGGFVSGTAGIAGGNVIVPTLVYFGTPMHNATATSSAMGVPIAAAGSLGYVLSADVFLSSGMLGYVDLESWLLITIAAVSTAPLGVRTAHRVSAPSLKRYFGALLLLVAGRMFYSSYMLM